MTKRLLSIKEAAGFLNMGVFTLRELVWAQRLPVVQINKNGRLLFDVHDLEKFIDQNKRRARA